MREEFSPLFSRRGHDRFPLTGQAQITTRVARGISSLVADISSRGASIVTTVPFEKNEQLQVLLDPCVLFPSEIRRQARWSGAQRSRIISGRLVLISGSTTLYLSPKTFKHFPAVFPCNIP